MFHNSADPAIAGPIGAPQLPFRNDGRYTWFDLNKFGGKHYTASDAPKKHTQTPYVTGTSVLGMVYADGVMIAADTLASYGSLAKYQPLERIRGFGKNTIIGGSGDYSDLQYIFRFLDEQILENDLHEDGIEMAPSSIHSYLTRVLYQNRNKMDPLWNKLVIGGFKDGKGYLGFSDLLGTSYEDDTVATGYGDYIARPLMRQHFKPSLTHAEAKEILETCLRVLFYRDARASNKIQIATITKDGAQVSAPYELSTNWAVGAIKYAADIKQVDPYNNNNNNNNTVSS